ncbi:MAG: TlpA family protein disulfide reductase [Anaeromyxobacteraceae bacterium]|nr:TlpA family protein disulfide reductase [Anaeromyxobacteraceae bacterium]
MRAWTKLALLVLLAVVVGQVLVQGGQPPLRAGAEAPPLSLRALDGGVVDLASLRGRVVAVNFWATWCPPCVRELPDLAATWQANKDRCFELLGVAEESAREDVEAAARRIPYPVLVDPLAAVASAWKVAGYPRTYLVDPAGHVRRVFEGQVSRSELEGAVAQLRPDSCPAR